VNLPRGRGPAGKRLLKSSNASWQVRTDVMTESSKARQRMHLGFSSSYTRASRRQTITHPSPIESESNSTDCETSEPVQAKEISAMSEKNRSRSESGDEAFKWPGRSCWSPRHRYFAEAYRRPEHCVVCQHPARTRNSYGHNANCSFSASPHNEASKSS